MARIVDFYPSSDDDLPDLTSFVKKQGPRPERSGLVLKASPQKDLIPKSATKSVARKVRRLENNSKLKGNLLFQPRGPEEAQDPDTTIFAGSPKTSPSKRSVNAVRNDGFPNNSIFAMDDSPPATTRAERRMRKRIIPILEDEKIDDPTDTALQIDHLLSIQTPGHLRAKPSLFHQSQRPTTKAAPHSSRNMPPIHETNLRDAESLVDKTHVDEPTSINLDEDSSFGFNSNSSSSQLSPDESSYSDRSDSNSTSTFDDSRLQEKQVHGNSGSGVSNVLQPRVPNSLNVLSGLAKVPASSAAKQADDSGLDLARELSRLRLGDEDRTEESVPSSESSESPTPQTPTKAAKPRSLTSPSKKSSIPKTPHRPSTNTFWNQGFVDEWNSQHSPQKPTLLAAPGDASKHIPKKGARKEFDSSKRDIAHQFLGELDTQITSGKIAELAELTGGVQLIWSKTLNTTAGRANWRRETIRTKGAEGTDFEVTYKHHSSIELAEKVIDDEEKLLNVVAHEFCHLANFMITGITNNPHGKEFKSWAAKCSRSFGDRGVKVTTKHSYDIAFKYVWECAACGSEYKRHSRSIDPEKHRCGKCKGSLKQTKPQPRGGGKPSEYQIFVREQMKVVKEENPGIAQKDVMKVIAKKWAQRPSKEASPAESSQEEVSSAVQDKGDAGLMQVVDLAL